MVKIESVMGSCVRVRKDKTSRHRSRLTEGMCIIVNSAIINENKFKLFPSTLKIQVLLRTRIIDKDKSVYRDYAKKPYKPFFVFTMQQ